MLLTSTYFSHMPNQHYATHAPVRSSPLRERSANAGAGLFDFSMESRTDEKRFAQPQRTHKANPALQTRDAATKRRREMFFKRVQNSREEKKWECRGEQVHSLTCCAVWRFSDLAQIQQLDFVSERKRWESRKAQEAPPEEHEIDEELLSDAMLPQSSYKPQQPELKMSEADHIFAQEEHELQQLIASMEQEQSHEPMSQHYGSDDDDYDQIFMQCATDFDSEYQRWTPTPSAAYGDVDDMDMTDG